MRRILLGALVAAGIGAGCATSGEIQSNAYSHLQRAQYLEAQGDYHGANKQRQAANKQFAKAQQRAYEESIGRAYWW